MTIKSVSDELEKLLVLTTDERLWEDKTDGEIAQALRLKMLNEIRESCWRVEGMVTSFQAELKAILRIVEIREIIENKIQDLWPDN